MEIFFIFLKMTIVGQNFNIFKFFQFILYKQIFETETKPFIDLNINLSIRSL